MAPANHNKLMQLINSMVVKQDAIMRGPTKKTRGDCLHGARA